MDIDSGIKRQLDAFHEILDDISRLHDKVPESREQRQEVADSIHLKLKDYQQNVTSLEFLIQDEVDSEEKMRHMVVLDRLNENLKLAKSNFRKAQIQSKKNAESSRKAERELLFGNRDNDMKKNKDVNKSMDERVIDKSEDITATLRRVHQMAQGEVIKSSLNIEELEQSTKSLLQLEKKYTSFDVILNGSQRLVRHLEEADRWDRIYMLAALSFLGAVLLWILWRRIFKAPAMLILWSLSKALHIYKFFASKESEPVLVASSHLSSMIASVESSMSISEPIDTLWDSISTATASIVEPLTNHAHEGI